MMVMPASGCVCGCEYGSESECGCKCESEVECINPSPYLSRYSGGYDGCDQSEQLAHAQTEHEHYQHECEESAIWYVSDGDVGCRV
jgi:hypothetical protein